MSVYISSCAWRGSKTEGSTLLVLLAIADRADDDGIAYPSVKTLAAKARCSERTTQYALRELIAHEELFIERSAGPKGCNLYRVNVAAMTHQVILSEGGANSAGVQPGSLGGATRCTQYTRDTSDKKKESAGAKPKRVPEPVFNPVTGQFDGLTPETIAQWVAANPTVDVPLEITRASCWLIANPERSKTRYLRFLAGWMTRASERREIGATAALAGPRPLNEKERHREEWAKGMRESAARIRASDAEQHNQRAPDDDNTFDA